MASGYSTSSETVATPYTKCQLCMESNIRCKCLTCGQYLCYDCKKLHLKRNAADRHEVTGIEDNKEKYNLKCRVHPTQELNMFCKECDILVCRDCIGNTHGAHTILNTEDIINEKQNELSKIIDDSHEKLYAFELAVSSMKKIYFDFSQNVSNCISEVRTRNVQLKMNLDKMTDDLINKLETIKKDGELKLKTKDIELENELAELKEVIRRCREKQTQREMELVKFVQDVKQRLDQFKPFNPPDPPKIPTFVTKEIDKQDVWGLVYGDLDPVIDVKIMSTFSMRGIDLVAAVGDNQAWVGCGGNKEITLVKSDGDVIQTVNTDCNVHGLAVTNFSELLIIADSLLDGNEVYMVKKMASNGEFVELLVLPPGQTADAISVTDNNDILIGVCDMLTAGANGDTCKLVQISPTGQVVNTIEYENDGETPLFGEPIRRISCNRNGDVIVTQFDKILVLDKMGHKRFEYTGQEEGLEEPFDPHFTTTDQYGNILIGDIKLGFPPSTSVIHLLDKNGNFLQCLLTEEHGLMEPYGLSVDKLHRLWVCNYGKNGIMVVKYIW